MNQPIFFLWAASCFGMFLATAAVAQEPVQERREQILKRFHEEFVPLAPGTGKFPASFQMGTDRDGLASAQPAHKVTFGYSFDMARYEITQELYEVIMGKNPSRWKGPRNSVEMINWHEANEFCGKVTVELRKRKLLGEGEEIRLPSEAEWEYACRAGTTTSYSFGNDVAALTDYAWYKGNSKGHDPPVGKKKPNAWGLYDMHGYVWEWCSDAWHPDYQGAPADGSPRRQANAKEVVMRGGAWSDSADAARSAFRHHRPPEALSEAIGFRCVRAKKK